MIFAWWWYQSGVNELSTKANLLSESGDGKYKLHIHMYHATMIQHNRHDSDMAVEVGTVL